MDIRLFSPQANGLGVGDEMDFMSALGQFQPKFGGHNSAAAVSRITGDSNLHLPGAAFRLLCHSMAGMGSGCRFYTSERGLRTETVRYSVVFGPRVLEESR